ncbi:nuclear transport factor 2 family protein [Gordonia neofelifaecis]|uniref:SnoaL-like domain-containing protein n=1 Tax=Gordonia neofelifaecis NRRL B-59395 TaxID=644548 RepID=F1YIA5_9ACTN|nr:nuclear transport factor 2 family protein [Gordonia neofelifaecis]EGD55659.1 hypothetical protein SCNU_08098 [Gordonia neofelifaecis NRRL B-59395]
MPLDDELRRLTDEAAIYRALTAYCHGIDRRDLELVRSVYHPGAVDHHTGFDGPVEEFIEWVGPVLGKLGGTMHTLGNHRVELFGDHAMSETYATATHWGRDSSDLGSNFTTGVRYVDHFERRNGRWAIAERFAVREWLRTEGDRLTGVAPRTDEDPTRTFRSQLEQLTTEGNTSC